MNKEFEFSGKAMGTEYFISVVCDSQELALNMYEIAKNDIEIYEAKFSRFLPTSELSLLNQHKHMQVSQTFLEVTEKAYELFTETKGIFNPLVQVARFGYDTNFNDIQNDKDNYDESPYDIDFSSVIIDHRASHIYLQEGQKLDFGGFLKGYLAEMITKKIKLYSSKICGVIVNMGGDIYTQGFDAQGNKFVFTIYNPVVSNNDISVTLYNQSLATSGTYKRSWQHSGKKMHHILDSSGTQNPESDIVSASVIHTDGARAEAYTKVFISMNHDTALQLLPEEDVSFIITKNDGKIIKHIL